MILEVKLSLVYNEHNKREIVDMLLYYLFYFPFFNKIIFRVINQVLVNKCKAAH